MQEKKDAGRCRHHGSPWDFPKRFYACGCAMDKWTWKRGMEEASAEAFGPPAEPRQYQVLGEDDGYHD